MNQPFTRLFARPPRLPLIAPSILSADFARMGEDCRSVLDAGADLLHLDVMDGHFVPNLTLGPDMCRGLRRALPEAFLDVHLMVTDPGNFVESFAKAGANHVTFHVEVGSLKSSRDLIARIRLAGMTAGLAINPPTPVEAILPLVEDADLILVMSVNPGYSGQAFITEVLAKTRAIKSKLRPDQRLEMDGGIAPDTVRAVREAGCDVLVAGSAVFGQHPSNRSATMSALRS